MWWLYVVECFKDESLYTGITTDLERRLRQHNGELAGGSRYVRSRRPAKLIAAWPYPNNSEAQKAERVFKKLTRKQKLERIHEQRNDRLPLGRPPRA